MVENLIDDLIEKNASVIPLKKKEEKKKHPRRFPYFLIEPTKKKNISYFFLWFFDIQNLSLIT